MERNDIDAIANALAARMSGSNKAPQSRLGIGSGVARPAGLDSPDAAVRQDARASYVKEMTDRAPMEQLNASELAEVFAATQDVLRQDGYHV